MLNQIKIKKKIILSLFCNVGIAEMYLPRAGFTIGVACELLEKRMKFYKEEYPKTICISGNIKKKRIKEKIIKNSKEIGVDIVMATPPCQGFSIAGKRIANDPRNMLIIDAMYIFKRINPKYIFIENVPQYFKDKITYKNKDEVVLDILKKEFGQKYNIKSAILDAKDFKIPQNRKRAFVLLSRKDQKIWDFPKPSNKIITVRDVIGDLPSLQPNIRGEQNKSRDLNPLPNHFRPTHNFRHILFMSNTPTGRTAFDNDVHYPKTKSGEKIKGFKTAYKRMEWDKPAPTITMMNGSISSQNNVHPGRLQKDGLYSDPRVLTLRELFILNSIPADWKFPKWASHNFIRQVVGESIPPLLVLKIFRGIK